MALMLKPPSVEPVNIDSDLFIVYYLNVYILERSHCHAENRR